MARYIRKKCDAIRIAKPEMLGQLMILLMPTISLPYSGEKDISQQVLISG